MKTYSKILFILFVLMGSYLSNSSAQTKSANKIILIENFDKAFIFEGDNELRFEFMLKNLYSEESTKPYLEKASFFPEIKKLVIKNVPDQQGRRYCYATIDKADKLVTITKLLNLLDVKEIIVVDKSTDIAGFIEMCK